MGILQLPRPSAILLPRDMPSRALLQILNKGKFPDRWATRDVLAAGQLRRWFTRMTRAMRQRALGRFRGSYLWDFLAPLALPLTLKNRPNPVNPSQLLLAETSTNHLVNNCSSIPDCFACGPSSSLVIALEIDGVETPCGCIDIIYENEDDVTLWGFTDTSEGSTNINAAYCLMRDSIVHSTFGNTNTCTYSFDFGTPIVIHGFLPGDDGNCESVESDFEVPGIDVIVTCHIDDSTYDITVQDRGTGHGPGNYFIQSATGLTSLAGTLSNTRIACGDSPQPPGGGQGIGGTATYDLTGAGC